MKLEVGQLYRLKHDTVSELHTYANSENKTMVFVFVQTPDGIFKEIRFVKIGSLLLYVGTEKKECVFGIGTSNKTSRVFTKFLLGKQVIYLNDEEYSVQDCHFHPYNILERV